MRHAVSHLHFVGIGGAGMAPIAELFHRQGLRVSGSDRARSAATERLAALGIAVSYGHDAAHVGDAQAVVASSAIPADNPELAAARARGVPVVARAAMLAELLRRRTGVAVAGTHGKTTTTSLVAAVLLAAGADPGFVIGGRLRGAGDGGGEGDAARPGGGEAMVVEADESDASFLLLSPIVAVVTNIDADHMETYGHRVERLHEAFADFIHRLPFYGRAVLCADDPGVRAVLPRLRRPLTLYGTGEEETLRAPLAAADAARAQVLRAVEVQTLPGARMRFVARQHGHADLAVTLALAGLHNVRNALAAIAVARELRLPDAPVAAALAAFGGVGRRFEPHGDVATADGGRAAVIDDYGHHPVELEAVIDAARGAFPQRRLVLAFQPHRYSRTRDCLDGFVQALSRADAVWLADVYPAGEAPIAGADSAALAAALQRAAPALPLARADGVPALALALARGLRDGDVLLTLGAGSIGTLPAQLRAAAGAAGPAAADAPSAPAATGAPA